MYFHHLRPENKSSKRKRRILKSFVSNGGLAGTTTISILYPLGFMRTRLATDVGNKAERLYPEECEMFSVRYGKQMECVVSTKVMVLLYSALVCIDLFTWEDMIS